MVVQFDLQHHIHKTVIRQIDNKSFFIYNGEQTACKDSTYELVSKIVYLIGVSCKVNDSFTVLSSSSTWSRIAFWGFEHLSTNATYFPAASALRKNSTHAAVKMFKTGCGLHQQFRCLQIAGCHVFHAQKLLSLHRIQPGKPGTTQINGDFVIYCSVWLHIFCLVGLRWPPGPCEWERLINVFS